MRRKTNTSVTKPAKRTVMRRRAFKAMYSSADLIAELIRSRRWRRHLARSFKVQRSGPFSVAD